MEMAEILRDGGLIVFPTETFYGLGAHALDAGALERVYHLKGRPPHLPLLCLVDGLSRLDDLVLFIPESAKVLMEAFWPAPLTLVFPARKDIPEYLVGDSGGVAVRWSPLSVVQALISHTQFPIVGTSANPSGEPPQTTVQTLSPAILNGVEGILDGGATPGDLPSTVIDCTGSPFRVIREGAISRKTLNLFSIR